MFGRRKREDAEAAREVERRRLFEELAKRPDTVCPFLGLAAARTEYHDGVTDDHRCYAFGDPAELSAEQQQKVCLQRGYGNCPRYLRGVLVIPTEELEALRRPQPIQPRPPTPPPPAAPVASGSGGSRRGIIVVALALLLAVGAGAGTLMLLGDRNGVASQTPTPSALPSETGSIGPSPTDGASGTPEPTPEPTPFVRPSDGALPTPGPGDEPTGFVVFVNAREYPVVRLDDDGNIVEEATAVFDDESGAPVERIVDGETIYWKTLQGDYTGLAYSRSLSGGFTIYETFQTDEGEPRFRELGEDEL